MLTKNCSQQKEKLLEKIKKQAIFKKSLAYHKKVVRRKGFEPPTFWFVEIGGRKNSNFFGMKTVGTGLGAYADEMILCVLTDITLRRQSRKSHQFMRCLICMIRS